MHPRKFSHEKHDTAYGVTVHGTKLPYDFYFNAEEIAKRWNRLKALKPVNSVCIPNMGVAA